MRSTGTFLVVQWLRIYTSTVGGTGSIPSQGIKIPYATPCSQKTTTTKKMNQINFVLKDLDRRSVVNDQKFQNLGRMASESLCIYLITLFKAHKLKQQHNTAVLDEDHCYCLGLSDLVLGKALILRIYTTRHPTPQSPLQCLLFSWHMGFQFSHQGSNQCPLNWKHRVLTTGQPGKSLLHVLFKQRLTFPLILYCPSYQAQCWV